jgi:hypothetical protein
MKLFDALHPDFRRSTLRLLPPEDQRSEAALRRWAAGLRRQYAGNDLVIVSQDQHLLGLPLRRTLSPSERVAIFDWLLAEPTFVLARVNDAQSSILLPTSTNAAMQGGRHGD